MALIQATNGYFLSVLHVTIRIQSFHSKTALHDRVTARSSDCFSLASVAEGATKDQRALAPSRPAPFRAFVALGRAALFSIAGRRPRHCLTSTTSRRAHLASARRRRWRSRTTATRPPRLCASLTSTALAGLTLTAQKEGLELTPTSGHPSQDRTPSPWSLKEKLPILSVPTRRAPRALRAVARPFGSSLTHSQ